MPSPNRTPMEAVQEQEWDSNRLKGFATKLQAEQWLGPDSMDWVSLITRCDDFCVVS